MSSTSSREAVKAAVVVGGRTAAKITIPTKYYEDFRAVAKAEDRAVSDVLSGYVALVVARGDILAPVESLPDSIREVIYAKLQATITEALEAMGAALTE